MKNQYFLFYLVSVSCSDRLAIFVLSGAPCSNEKFLFHDCSVLFINDISEICSQNAFTIHYYNCCWYEITVSQNFNKEPVILKSKNIVKIYEERFKILIVSEPLSFDSGLEIFHFNLIKISKNNSNKIFTYHIWNRIVYENCLWYPLWN